MTTTKTCPHARLAHRACADAHLDLFVCSGCGFRIVTPRLIPRPALRHLKAALRVARAMRRACGVTLWCEIPCACKDAPYIAYFLMHAGFRIVIAEGAAMLMAEVRGR